ncbi:acetyl-CoA carboxylase biotin carboxylase subunit [Bacillus mesophilus]|uniref:biotin carboxylase n=1 Tax=Bacillus mesophilus TaxID=1808955 RepID=A0A6M0Q2G2_9BACI|nr:acetyl-CoA carboxylase biotin carboxylase subunit [Bacillus mesophilus]MBM7659471.1 acetyl-CoA carboxylase biotin carboxylase subunit [Bacillus mesophilus]NEY70344.1 acetyl-CoA carboxylase biotin carboxylase subunit [Bacillus mesophilus]
MKKILIANRGEIALRIIKTCKKVGIETVAIYSEADASLPYVKEATISYCIGEPPVQKSYLDADKIIEIAKKEQVDAIHPGYGFLSENATFAQKVEDNGITFIGPSASIISKMGDKILARQTMKQAGVPVVPGSDFGLKSLEEVVQVAGEIGYPVMLKASAGGGGVGMQKCDNEEMLTKAYQSTKARAKAYFGNDELFLEKFISNARHIEVQIVGDSFGNVIHLFERDCSIQRRNQKVIEEAPSPFLSESTRAELYSKAVLAAKAVNYENAGTVEFVMDDQEQFYFLEMNTRLQVEHPVTEMITNIDLVEWQLLISMGKPLPLTQEAVNGLGHAIEFRLYAEDPNTFLPSPGHINEFNYSLTDGVRVDYGYLGDNAVTTFYDPMIAKVIVHGHDREQAIKKASEFFNNLSITGIKHNGPLFEKIIQDEQFMSGHYTTAYLKK